MSEPSEQPSVNTHERKTFFQRALQLLRRKSLSDLRDDLADVLAENDEGGSSFSAGEREMLNNILSFREISVENVMIPRADVIGVDIDTSLGNLLEKFEEAGHSRMPVYAKDLDDPRGMVHMRDVLTHITQTARVKKKNASSALDLTHIDLSKTIGELNLIRDVLFVPHSMLAGDLLQRMRATRTQMALVIDEYGGTDGLCSLEDVVEMVVGDIEDEHDDAHSSITELANGVYIADGGMELKELKQKIGDDFSVGKYGEDVDTIAGLMIAVLGHHPVHGETCVPMPGFEFKVTEVRNRRIHKVRISRIISDVT